MEQNRESFFPKKCWREVETKLIKLAPTFLIFLFLYFFRLWQVSQKQIDFPSGSQVKVIARISQQPYLSASKQIIRLGQFLVITEPFPEFFYGQKLEIIGKPTKKVIGEFQKEFIFNYPAIRIFPEEKTLIDQRKIIGSLLVFRRRLENLFSSFLPEPEAGLLAGVVLGSQGRIPNEFRQNLRKTGTTHLVVASGFNVTIIAGFLMAVLTKFLRRQYALLFSFLGIIIYMLMVGAEPPIVRAAIMGSLTYLGQLIGREKDAVNALIFSGMIMLLSNPLLIFNKGFQLSFLATAGILLIQPRLKGRVFQLPIFGEDLRTTLAAQAGVFPLLLFNFGQINPFSFLINALILPLVPLVMILGGITALWGLVYHSFGQIASWAAYLPLTLMVRIINFFGGLPFPLIEVEKVSFLWLIGYYGILGIWLAGGKKILKKILMNKESLTSLEG